MRVKTLPARESDKHLIAAMLQPYLRELSHYFAPGEPKQDHYEYVYLDAYWQEPNDRFPFLILVDDEVAGFAMVNRHSRLGATDTLSMAEFFVKPEFRRDGVGATAACQIFAAFASKWEVAVLAGNDAADRFWQRVINDAAIGKMTQSTTERWNGVIYSFETAADVHSTSV